MIVNTERSVTDQIHCLVKHIQRVNYFERPHNYFMKVGRTLKHPPQLNQQLKTINSYRFINSFGTHSI